jgi:Protein of unknown function (DUF3501)
MSDHIPQARVMSRLLTIDDIAEPRSYERQRDSFRQRVIALKAIRRVHVGTIVSVVFENRDTMLFQVQEMARAEKMITDAQIQHELNTFNPLIPQPGELSATMFIECTTDEQMKYWFPRLVGIETTMEFHLGPESSSDLQVIRCQVDADHEAQLTREDITSAVHYIRWSFTPQQAEMFTKGDVRLVCSHANYGESAQLTPGTIKELNQDLAYES